jgi:hypothetical protein
MECIVGTADDVDTVGYDDVVLVVAVAFKTSSDG